MKDEEDENEEDRTRQWQDGANARPSDRQGESDRREHGPREGGR